MSGIINKTRDEINAILDRLTGVDTGDDKGVIVSDGELSVGTPAQGAETVMGGGDSYAVGSNGSIAFHADTANTTGLTITSATDVTEILGSDSESVTGLFDGTTTGKYILIGSDYTFGGVKVKTETAGIVEDDNAIGEYMPVSGTWIETTRMVTKSDGTEQRAETVASEAGSEHWRFGFDPTNLSVPWGKATININGTDYTKYWARFRLDAGITSDPSIQQVKLHTNRLEINANGTGEKFGIARSKEVIIKNLKQWSNTSTSPANEPIKYADDITLSQIDNEFANGAVDSIGVSFKLPIGFDTSIPLTLNLDWYVKGTDAGDVEWDISHCVFPLASVLDGTKVSRKQSKVVAVDNQNEVLTRTTFLLLIEKALIGDTIAVKVKRDASSGNLEDTLAANVVAEGASIIGHKWRV